MIWRRQKPSFSKKLGFLGRSAGPCAPTILRVPNPLMCLKLQGAFDNTCNHVTLRKISPYSVSYLMTLMLDCWRPAPTPLHHPISFTEAPASG